MANKVITVACGIANQKVFDHCLGASLKRQNVKHKFIAENVGLPASKARNSMKIRFTTNYVAFIHQDVIMMEDSWLKRAEEFCDKLPKLGMAGVSGCGWGGRMNGYILLHMSRKQVEYYGKKYYAHKHGCPMKNPQKCITLDGVVQIIPRTILNKVSYDERLKQELAVDMCLQLKWKLNLDAWTLPLKTWHNVGRGGGRGWTKNPIEPRHGYTTPFGVKGMRKANEFIFKKWKNRFSVIYSTANLHAYFRQKGLARVKRK